MDSLAIEVKKDRALRDRALVWLYEQSDGKTYPAQRVRPDEVSIALGVSENKIQTALQHLAECGVVNAKQSAAAYGIAICGITTTGLAAAEDLISPVLVASDFPQAQNVIVFGSATGCHIVQGSEDVKISNSQLHDFDELAKNIRELIEQNLVGDDADIARINLETAETQMKSKRPMPTVIAAPLNMIMQILVQAGAASAVAILRTKFPEFFGI